MADWSFLTKHARALLLIAINPEVRLRDLATAIDVTERTAFGIVADLTEAGYVTKERDGRRNRYHVHAHLVLHDAVVRERTIGQLVELFAHPSGTEGSDSTVQRAVPTSSGPAATSMSSKAVPSAARSADTDRPSLGDRRARRGTSADRMNL